MSRVLKAVLGVAVVAGIALAVGVRMRFNENRRCCDFPTGRNLIVSLQETLFLKKTFSQFGQDKWIADVVFPGVTGGFFVDLGSADGTINSNSRLLEQRGWRGICIDPFPTNMDGRTCQVFKEVVSNEAGQKVSFRQAADLGGIDQNLGVWKDQARLEPAVELITTTLADVLARGHAPAYIHYLSIDIEGAELLALQGLPFDRYTIGAMTIEHNFEEPKRSQIKALLEGHGYRRAHESTLDDFYVRGGGK